MSKEDEDQELLIAQQGQLQKLRCVEVAAKTMQRERRRLLLGSPLGNEALLLKAFDELDNALWNADSSLE